MAQSANLGHRNIADALRKKKPPEGGLYYFNLVVALCDSEATAGAATISHEANAEETDDHHRPGGRFGNRSDVTSPIDDIKPHNEIVEILVGTRTTIIQRDDTASATSEGAKNCA